MILLVEEIFSCLFQTMKNDASDDQLGLCVLCVKKSARRQNGCRADLHMSSCGHKKAYISSLYCSSTLYEGRMQRAVVRLIHHIHLLLLAIFTVCIRNLIVRYSSQSRRLNVISMYFNVDICRKSDSYTLRTEVMVL